MVCCTKRKVERASRVYDVMGGYKYLSHAGLLNLESIMTFDASGTSLKSYYWIKGAKKIRYLQKDNKRFFEIVEK